METQVAFDSLLKLVEETTKTFRKQFAQLQTLYQSSDPSGSLLTQNALDQLDIQKKEIEKRIKAIGNFKDLTWAERLKIGFSLIYHFQEYQNPLTQMRLALDNAQVQSSLASSDFTYLDQVASILRSTYEKYMTNVFEIQKTSINLLIEDIFADIDHDTIDYDILTKTYEKYPTISMYSAVIRFMFEHYKAAELISNLEVMKDRLLGTYRNEPNNFPIRIFQLYDLMPASIYMPLEIIMKEFIHYTGKINTIEQLSGIARQMSNNERSFSFVVIYRPSNVLYNPWNIGDVNHIEQNKLSVDPENGITIKSLDTFRTIDDRILTQPTMGDVVIYPKNTKSKEKSKEKDGGNEKDPKSRHSSKSYYFILETYDKTNFRLLTPWNIFPSFKSPTAYVPDSWLPDIDNKLVYPSARVETYNDIFAAEILKHKDKNPIKFELNSKDMSKEQGAMTTILSDWFMEQTKKKMPRDIGEYRDLINSDAFKQYIEEQLYLILKAEYSQYIDNTEINLTILSVSSAISHRIAREILGVTTKTNNVRLIYETYTDGKLLIEIQNMFKTHIKQTANIVINYNTLYGPIETKINICK